MTATCSLDHDGFCAEHGWDCDDFRLYQAERTEPATAGRETGSRIPMTRQVNAQVNAVVLPVTQANAEAVIAWLRELNYTIVEQGRGINADGIVFGNHDWELRRAPFGGYLVFEQGRLHILTAEAFEELSYKAVPAQPAPPTTTEGLCST